MKAWGAKRRADLLQRTPPWADIEKIRGFYENCPKDKVVDHIIPLKGKLVSGLHIETNLQYLTPIANGQKSNKFDPDEYKKTEHFKKWTKQAKRITRKLLKRGG